MFHKNINYKELLSQHYPFKSNYYVHPTTKYRLHYLDEAHNPDVDHPPKKTVVLLHGNPTWSFFYRNLILVLKVAGFRVIVPDHLGMGLSDKPNDYSQYNLKNHIENLQLLLCEHLKLKKFSLIVHDWGGAIGMGLMVRANIGGDLVEKVVIMNTAAFTSKNIPYRIALLKLPFLGKILSRGFNLFALAATIMTTKKPLSKEIKSLYLYPYDSYNNRIAIDAFVKDIPLHKFHHTFFELKNIEKRLTSPELKKIPKLILWGERDFCFNLKFLKRWREIYPDARVKTYKNADHYLLEDEGEDIAKEINNFLNS
ncbi:MAG: alpha/beta fold hydrolase [Oligoflexia bacterium]|nr:alpha/beta fold hydrolase [Oligoflexia bacterium]